MMTMYDKIVYAFVQIWSEPALLVSLEWICDESNTRQSVIRLFSCSTKFQLLIKTKMLKNQNFSCFQTLRCFIYHANKCKIVNNL